MYYNIHVYIYNYFLEPSKISQQKSIVISSFRGAVTQVPR